jgi:hypothetical protein
MTKEEQWKREAEHFENCIHGMNLLPFINNHIEDLTEWDTGALQVREENVVDIEWADGVSAFDLEKVLNLIKEKGNITKSELVDECLA